MQRNRDSRTVERESSNCNDCYLVRGNLSQRDPPQLQIKGGRYDTKNIDYDQSQYYVVFQVLIVYNLRFGRFDTKFNNIMGTQTMFDS